MSIVIDASVALKWVLDEPGADAADALLDEDLIAPSLWMIEAANALWRRERRGEISGEQAQARLAELCNAPVSTVGVEEDLLATAALARRLGHPVYDCLYLALAIRQDTYVVTADRRFQSVVGAAPDLADRVRRLTP